MAWGEFHVLTGVALQEASAGRWWLALPLAILSHWPLDDLNVGPVARIYHGTGTGWRSAATIFFRIPIIGALTYLFWQRPELLICGLPAWLILDHEWILNLFGRHGYGLHARMWPAWLHTEAGLIPWAIAFALFVALCCSGPLF